MATVTVRNQSHESGHERCMNESSSIQYQASAYERQSLTCKYCEQIETSKDAFDQHSSECAKKTDECPKCRKFVARGIFADHYANNCEDPKGSDASTSQPTPTPRKRSSLQRGSKSASKETGSVARELHSSDSIVLIPCQFCNEAVELPIWSQHTQDCREKEIQRETLPAQPSRRGSNSAEIPPKRSEPKETKTSNKPTAAPRSGSLRRSNSVSSLNGSYQANSGRRTPSAHSKHSSSFSSNEKTQINGQSKPRGNPPLPALRSPSPRPPKSDDSKSKATKISKNASPDNLTLKQTPGQRSSRTQSLTRPNSPSKHSRSGASSSSSVRRQSASSGKNNGRGGSNPSQSNASKSLAGSNAPVSPDTNSQRSDAKIMGSTPRTINKGKSGGKNVLPSKEKRNQK